MIDEAFAWEDEPNLGACAEADTNDPGSSESIADIVPFSADTIPTQTLLVDMLQLILQRAPPTETVRRIAVVVSAWDVLSASPISPDEWLKQQLPLLDQFFRSRQEELATRIYGISAFGGDPKSDQERLLKIADPAHRVVVRGVDASPHDVSAPLRWLIGG